MIDIPSRNERLLQKAENAAQKRKWGLEATLYPSEVSRIQRQWKVSVIILRQNEEKVDCYISWEKAFSDSGLNYKQSWYISYILDEMPQVENVAQRLYLISARA